MAAGHVTALSSSPGIDCVEAQFAGRAFAPHSHDTYGIGITTNGVQAFDYRGESRQSMPGDVFVLHSCERHDGRQGDDRGFGYRIAYIDPALLRNASETDGLPFVSEPVVSDERLRHAVLSLFMHGPDGDGCFSQTDGLTRLAYHLARLAKVNRTSSDSIDQRAMTIARDYLSDTTRDRASISDLESETGLSRWQLTRQFRKAFGASPYQFHLFRRLDRVRDELERGVPLAEASVSAGFADQAHMTRHFKRAFGFSPGAWRSLVSDHHSRA